MDLKGIEGVEGVEVTANLEVLQFLGPLERMLKNTLAKNEFCNPSQIYQAVPYPFHMYSFRKLKRLICCSFTVSAQSFA